MPYEVSPYDQCSFVCSAAAVAMVVPLSMFPASLKIRDRGQWTCRNLTSGAVHKCSSASRLVVQLIAFSDCRPWQGPTNVLAESKCQKPCAGFEKVVWPQSEASQV